MENSVVVGRVGSIWHYPVMGLQGEQLNSVAVLELGVKGDRRYALYDKRAQGVIDATKWNYDWGETTAVRTCSNCKPISCRIFQAFC